MDTFNEIETQPVDNKRPSVITVFCILTLVGAGLSALLSLIFIMANVTDPFEAYVMGIPPIMFNAVFFLMAGGRIAGAILMLNMKKAGFILYVSAEGVAFLANIFWFVQMIGRGWIQEEIIAMWGLGFFVSVLVTALFVVMYSINFKKMK